jgi:nucleoside-diphosphate-sugar epimerase
VVRADIFDEASMTTALNGCELGINLATSLPSPGSQTGDYAKNDTLRREGTPRWIQACKAAGVARVVQQSIAMVHAGGGDAIADEDTFYPQDETTVAGAAAIAALAMERTVQDSGLDWTILRGGLFYGPGTGFDDDWFARARAGTLRLPGDGSDYVSLVHIADMAAATVAAIAQWPSRQALIVSDDRPAPWRDVFSYVCALSQALEPKSGGRLLMPSFRVSNRRARETLRWAPFYSDFRAGLPR